MQWGELGFAAVYGAIAAWIWYIFISASQSGIIRLRSGVVLTQEKNPKMFGVVICTKLALAIVLSVAALARILAAFQGPLPT